MNVRGQFGETGKTSRNRKLLAQERITKLEHEKKECEEKLKNKTIQKIKSYVKTEFELPTKVTNAFVTGIHFTVYKVEKTKNSRPKFSKHLLFNLYFRSSATRPLNHIK